MAQSKRHQEENAPDASLVQKTDHKGDQTPEEDGEIEVSPPNMGFEVSIRELRQGSNQLNLSSVVHRDWSASVSIDHSWLQSQLDIEQPQIAAPD